MKLVDLDQNSSEWKQWRKEGIGASDACVIAGDVRWSSPDQLRRVKGGTEEIAENERMARGKRLEPEARLLYQDLTGIRVRPICVVHDLYPWMRASLDGLSEDNTLILEIKCPSDYAHKKALDGNFPHYYKAQLQHQFAVTDLHKLHYFSFTDSKTFRPDDRCALVPVARDEDYIVHLFEKERRFYESLKSAPKRVRRSSVKRPVPAAGRAR